MRCEQGVLEYCITPKTIQEMNKSVSQMDYTGIEYPLRTNIRHKTQPVDAKHIQCQCIV